MSLNEKIYFYMSQIWTAVELGGIKWNWYSI